MQLRRPLQRHPPPGYHVASSAAEIRSPAAYPQNSAGEKAVGDPDGTLPGCIPGPSPSSPRSCSHAFHSPTKSEPVKPQPPPPNPKLETEVHAASLSSLPATLTCGPRCAYALQGL